MWVALDLAANVLDVRVDGALVRFHGHAVDRVEQLGASEDAARLARHVKEQLELCRRQVDAPPIDGCLHSRDVEQHRLTHLHQVAV